MGSEGSICPRRNLHLTVLFFVWSNRICHTLEAKLLPALPVVLSSFWYLRKGTYRMLCLHVQFTQVMTELTDCNALSEANM